jgi:hypothetical protein
MNDVVEMTLNTALLMVVAQREPSIRNAIFSAINSDARYRTRPWCKTTDPDHRLDQGRRICIYCTRSGV